MDDFIRDQLANYYAEAGAQLGFWPAPQPAPPAPAGEPPPPQPPPPPPAKIPAGPRSPRFEPDFIRAALRRFR